MRRREADADELELGPDDDYLDDDRLDVLPHGDLWSRSAVGGVEGLRCREHDLLPAEH